MTKWRQRRATERAWDALWEPLQDWIHRPMPGAKRALLHAYRSLTEEERDALAADVATAAVTDPVTAYRRSKGEQELTGGMSLSTVKPPEYMRYDTYFVAVDAIMLHWAQPFSPLGHRAFGHEREIILKPDVDLSPNPPLSGWREGWWHKEAPERDKLCYRTKTDALNTFLDANWRIVEEWGGPNRKDDPSVFDAINHRHDLRGQRKVDTLAKAVWWAFAGPRPWCLERIDIDLLNATDAGAHAERELGEGFRLPDYIEEQRLLEEEPEWLAQYGIAEYPEDEEVPF